MISITTMHLTLFQKSLSFILRWRGTITIGVLEAPKETVAAVALPAAAGGFSLAHQQTRANTGAQRAKAQYTVFSPCAS
jgi:hypothetical protein